METRHKAYTFRMYPNEEQMVLLAKTFGCVRLVYNLMLADNYRFYTTNFVNGNIKFGNRTMTLPKLKTARIKKHREIPKGYILKSATISQEPNGNYYVSVLFECEEDEMRRVFLVKTHIRFYIL